MATKPRTIDEYLAGLSPEDRTALQKVRRAVHTAAPEAEECISYGMPAFRLHGKLIAGFKAAANHCSFHPMSGDTVATLESDLAGYDTSRGTIRFSARAGLPATLVRKLKGHGYTRRQVVERLAWAAAATAIDSPLASLGASGGAGKRVIVAGAGLAGLCAAYELVALGHDVTVLEAQNQAGGRVHTLRKPFSDGLYAEAGASRIPTSHDLTLAYARLFDLSLVPFEPIDLPSIRYAYHHRAKVPPEGAFDWPPSGPSRPKTVDASAGAEPLHRAARGPDRRPIRVGLDSAVAREVRQGHARRVFA